MARREITQFYDDLDNQLIGEDELEVGPDPCLVDT